MGAYLSDHGGLEEAVQRTYELMDPVNPKEPAGRLAGGGRTNCYAGPVEVAACTLAESHGLGRRRIATFCGRPLKTCSL